MKLATAAILAIALSSGCAGTFGSHSKPKAGVREQVAQCDPSYAAPVYLAGVALATFGLAYAIDSNSTPTTRSADQREVAGLGVVTGATTIGAALATYQANRCRARLESTAH